jgi:hypothetical protein
MIHIKLTDGAEARVRSTPETEALGLAGLSGPVFGETQPSSSRVNVIGNPAAARRHSGHRGAGLA